MKGLLKKINRCNCHNLGKLHRAIEAIENIRQASKEADEELINQGNDVDNALEAELDEEEDAYDADRMVCVQMEQTIADMEAEIANQEDIISQINHLKKILVKTSKNHKYFTQSINKANTETNRIQEVTRSFEVQNNEKRNKTRNAAFETKRIAEDVVKLNTKIDTLKSIVVKLKQKDIVTIDDQELMKLVATTEYGRYEEYKSSIESMLIEAGSIQQKRVAIEEKFIEDRLKFNDLIAEKEELARKHEALKKESNDSSLQVQSLKVNFDDLSKSFITKKLEFIAKTEKVKAEFERVKTSKRQHKYCKEISTMEEKMENEKLKSFKLGTDIDAMLKKAEESENSNSEDEEVAQVVKKISPERKFANLSLQHPVYASKKVVQGNVIDVKDAFDDEDDTDMGFSNNSFMNDTMEQSD